jgi:hypothetical protein
VNFLRHFKVIKKLKIEVTKTFNKNEQYTPKPRTIGATDWQLPKAYDLPEG